MAKQYFLKFPFTHTEADNEHIFATEIHSTIWVFYFSVVTVILVGKAAIINFMFFYYHSTDISFASNGPASNGFAEVLSKLLTEDDGNLPPEFWRMSGLKCPSTEVKRTF